MSASTAIPLSQELVSAWDAQKKSGSARYLKIQINNEECVLIEAKNKSSTQEQDFGALMSVVSPAEPCYIIFRMDYGGWLMVVFIPDKSKVTDKLVYAATSVTLRRQLGEPVSDEVHFSTLPELTWSSYRAAKAKAPCESEREQHIATLNDMEATARKEMEDDARAKAAAAASGKPAAAPAKQPRTLPQAPAKKSAAEKPKEAPKPAAAAAAPAKAAAPAAAKPAASASKEPNPIPIRSTPAGAKEDAVGSAGGIDTLRSAFERGTPAPVEPAAGPARSRSPMGFEEPLRVPALGGFHTVTLPWSEGAKGALRRIISGGTNFVSLKVEDESVQLDKADNVSALPAAISATEPRFIFYSRPGATFFIYSCPEKSRPRIRMVYSTCKPNVSQEAASLGLRITKKMEIRDPSEADHSHLEDALRPVRASDFARPTPTPAAPTVTAPHPICQIMTDGHVPKSGPGKKVVIPPSGAW